MSEQPFRFLDLPIELRLCIYERLQLESNHRVFRIRHRQYRETDVELIAVK